MPTVFKSFLNVFKLKTDRILGDMTVALCLDATILTAKFLPIPKRPTNIMHPLGLVKTHSQSAVIRYSNSVFSSTS